MVSVLLAFLMTSMVMTFGSANAMVARFVEPVRPYTIEMPYSNTPDEKAPSRKYFIDASFDFLSRRK